MEKQIPQIVDECSMGELPGRPYKIVDFKGEKRIGIVVKSLKELMDRAHIKFDISPDTPVRVALEEDGTEVEDEEYFSTLEDNTAFVILVGEQKWLPCGKYFGYRNTWDETDNEEKPPSPHLQKLVNEVYSDMTCLTLLGGRDLELLAGLNLDSVSDMCPNQDHSFLGNVKEATFRILAEKEQTKEALELLRLYHNYHIDKLRKEQKKEE